MMFGLILLAAPEIAAPVRPNPICDAIAVIEKATLDRPQAFRSLVVQVPTPTRERDATGKWTMVTRNVAAVRPLAGLVDCRFVYNAMISLACYGAQEAVEAEANSVDKVLADFSDEIAKCIKNENLVRQNSDFGSGMAVTFAGGAREPFYQISMVPLPHEDGKRRPELLVLGPAELPPAPVVRPAKSSPKKANPKSKRR